MEKEWAGFKDILECVCVYEREVCEVRKVGLGRGGSGGVRN